MMTGMMKSLMIICFGAILMVALIAGACAPMPPTAPQPAGNPLPLDADEMVVPLLDPVPFLPDDWAPDPIYSATTGELLAASGFGAAGGSAFALAPGSLYDLADYAEKVKAELGTFPSFNVLAGEIIPLTTDGATPAEYNSTTKVDRPPLLVLGCRNQAVPYSRIGRLEGSNPDTLWVFIGRRYIDRKDPMDPKFEDVAVIGWNPDTGATAFFQMLDDDSCDPARDGKLATNVPSPWDDIAAAKQFWLPPAATASIKCFTCHDNDPFVLTPYVAQVTMTNANGITETIVPSSLNTRKGKYRFVGQDTPPFSGWPRPEHISPTGNLCVSCHRIGLGASSDRFAAFAAGIPLRGDPSWNQMTDSSKLYPRSHWMPRGAVGAPSIADLDWAKTVAGLANQADWNRVYNSVPTSTPGTTPTPIPIAVPTSAANVAIIMATSPLTVMGSLNQIFSCGNEQRNPYDPLGFCMRMDIRSSP